MTTELPGYIHGYSDSEETRLIEQAELLAPFVFGGLDYSADGPLLELGCAVGAELKLMHRKWPRLELWGVDRAAGHLERARRYLAPEIAAGQVNLVEADAARLPFGDGRFGRVVTIWLLEHVPEPGRVIVEALRVLRPGGELVLTEVSNETLRFDPPVAEIAAWWDAFNRYQQQGGGDPFIGPKLEGFAKAAGAVGVRSQALRMIDTRRDPGERRKWAAYLQALLLSAAPGMIAAGLVSEADARLVRAAFARVPSDSSVSFRYDATRLVCRRGRDFLQIAK